METDEVEELSQRGEIFRSKLIEDFQLLDTLKSKGNIESPRFYSNEIQNPEIMEKMLKESPHSLVKFQVIAKREELKFTDRRLNRVRNKNRIPFGPWARSVTESSQVQNFIMFLIIANSIVLGLQAEIVHMKGTTMSLIKVFLNVIDYITLVVFVLEILVKWVDGFWVFWKNGWNIFDFFVTAMSIVPEVLSLALGGKSSSSISVIGDNMRVFKILRSLKMVSRFAQLRIIVLTIFKAFKSMAFIMILLMLFMYIFAVAGTIVFDSYSKSKRTDLKYRNSFRTLKNAFITLFQLFTLDHWYEIQQDMTKAVNPVVAKIYVLLWICIGAFVFRNIFAGIMVNNFQNIRNDFNQQIKEQIAVKERAEIRSQLADELEKHDKKHRKSRRASSLAVPGSTAQEGRDRRASSFLNRIFRRSTAHAFETATEEPKETEKKGEPKLPNFVSDLHEKIAQIRSNDQQSLKRTSSFHAYYARHTEDDGEDFVAQGGCVIPEMSSEMDEPRTTRVQFKEDEDEEDTKKKDEGEKTETDMEAEFADWQKTVDANLHNFQRYPMETLWPRDTLFKYFQMMEQLQENLVERKQLIRLIVEALLQLQDSKKVVSEETKQEKPPKSAT
ncbi:LOW QUALITY PROTEIN: cation channel sperm-associated protein 2-like [Dendronephthya gigantea]|uniref:LOW QUALITY PROTEIN: cation channel sperm-associated protein 2-like n=1 Tax=Dendronephthya gigantea TaxID=151771 RepID=UPI00106C14A7|nr:LOW QUALITY PROTEIN: cation channel sperm-associated protein 2-like [Dendronephthya gigantea]